MAVQGRLVGFSFGDDPGGRIVRCNKQLMIIKMHFPGATTAAAASIVGVWPNTVDRVILALR